jgi:hypothetical protein
MLGNYEKYDGNGLRIKKVSASTATVYVFSGSKVIAEYVNGAAPSSPTREYLYSRGTLLAKIESGATNYSWGSSFKPSDQFQRHG